MSNKKSIRFFNDREVRAIWSDADNKWYFSATDVVRAINNEPELLALVEKETVKQRDSTREQHSRLQI